MHQVQDRWGNLIELTDERWAYIRYWHPELTGHLDQVLAALRKGRRRQDPFDPTKYTYYFRTDALLPEYTHIIVIVRLIRNNFVITAYPKSMGD
jgi:hypothetical protein